jgi:copper chaperone CopZ
MGYYLHEIPGRLRVRIPNLKRNPQNAWDIQVLLKNLPGVKSISTNTVTGSIIVYYDPQLVNTAAIVNVLAREGYIDLAKVLFNKERKDNTMDVVAQAASKAILGFVLDRALQGTPLSIVTALI